MDVFTKNFYVSFLDINENNELSNKGILRLMQEVAGLHSASLGFGLNDIDKTGFAWLILNWKLKVFYRPKWNTYITVNTWSRKKTPLFAYRDLEIYDDKNNLVAIATSKWLLFNVNKKALSKITPEVNEAFNEVNKSVFNDEFNEKLKEPENSIFAYNYKIQKRDIDTNHHVNNLIYLDYAYEALPDDVFFNTDFSNIEIMYKHEAKINDVISVFYSNDENGNYTITIKDENNKNLHAIIKLSI